MPRKRRVTLRFEWYDVPSGGDDLSGHHWGQLVGGLSRIQLAVEGLHQAAADRNIHRALDRVGSAIEHLVICAYDLRERVVGMVGHETGDPGQAAKLKSPTKRAAAIGVLKPIKPKLLALVEEVLDLTDEPIRLRNLRTHKTFPHLAICVEEDSYDVYDSWTWFRGLSDDDARRMRRVIRAAIRHTVEEYANRGRQIFNVLEAILSETDPSKGHKSNGTT